MGWKFKVICDDSNNTPADIQAGRINTTIILKQVQSTYQGGPTMLHDPKPPPDDPDEDEDEEEEDDDEED